MPPSESSCAIPADSKIDVALRLAGLDRGSFGISEQALLESSAQMNGLLADGFRLPLAYEARTSPLHAGCIEGTVASSIDNALALPHPVSNLIRHAARLLEQSSDQGAPIDKAVIRGDFRAAVDSICALFPDRTGCGVSNGDLPNELAVALAPIVRAIAEGIDARLEQDRSLDPSRGPEFWSRSGGNGLLFSPDKIGYNQGYAPDRSYLSRDKSRLYRAAAQIAYAIEDASWKPFIGLMGVKFDLSTPAGWIRVRDGGNDLYEPGDDSLLLLDLGGDDVHYDDVASNRSASNAVSVAIDLAGNDTYTYHPGPRRDAAGLLASDEDGRFSGDSEHGQVSLSSHSRQGGARNGIAMLFDFGAGNDRYESLRASQGYAHHGVGVLFDDGGSDTYVAETASQGAAQFGIGLLIDLGPESDVYRSVNASQGFGFVGGAGILVDEAGDDTYSCDPGDVTAPQTVLYPSPQLVGKGNASFCQGAGFGFRSERKELALSGGIGVLRDLKGNDRYDASVYAQGVGYWQGLGILSDGAGNDQYDAVWYAQGSAAHFAAGILADSSNGNDIYNGTRAPLNVMLGAGHDFSAGIFFDEGGNDRYNIPLQSGGGSSCNGIGLFVDQMGDDRYVASSPVSLGVANAGACASLRPTAPSIALMLDSAGHDEYAVPGSALVMPRDGGSWGGAGGGLSSEHGAGLDAEGESGVHAMSGRAQPRPR